MQCSAWYIEQSLDSSSFDHFSNYARFLKVATNEMLHAGPYSYNPIYYLFKAILF